MICPKCKKNSVEKSETFTDMLLCKNKNCEWFLKEDIRKLQGINIEGFKFTYPSFEKIYETMMTNYEYKFHSKDQRQTFLQDFLTKHNNEDYLIITKDLDSKKDLKEFLQKNKYFPKNIEDISSYSEFTRQQKKDNHLIFYEIFDHKQVTNLKSLTRYCRTYFFFI